MYLLPKCHPNVPGMNEGPRRWHLPWTCCGRRQISVNEGCREGVDPMTNLSKHFVIMDGRSTMRQSLTYTTLLSFGKQILVDILKQVGSSQQNKERLEIFTNTSDKWFVQVEGSIWVSCTFKKTNLMSMMVTSGLGISETSWLAKTTWSERAYFCVHFCD